MLAKFEYDERLLSSCANSDLAAFVARGGNQEVRVPLGGSDESCSLLHQQHAIHYNRPTPKLFTKTGSRHPYEMDERFRRFVESVLLVHNHNSDHQHLHILALNHFADEEPPLRLDWTFGSPGLKEDGKEGLTFPDFDSIEKEWDFSTVGVGHGGMGHLHRTKPKKERSHRLEDPIAEKLKFPVRDSDPHFAVPSLDDPNLDGELLKVKPRRSMESQVESGEFEGTDEFGKHLNWASSNNPDGIRIVNGAIDQGECGSCWAFAAAGSLEASVSRRQAHEAFNEYLEAARRRLEKHPDRVYDEAVEFARSVEGAAFQMANLSIQELIDCDTAADQGCIGGNPLLAFYFIHRYGLSSWDQYPYVGYVGTCHKKWVSRPVAKVKSWGIISPNHEHHMELAIRYIGPIAVGVNGADRSFLAYQDGIFDHPYCRQGANHALLITGYGQEETYSGEAVKYWIARNSWGNDWGENGYIRIKRGDGLKGTRGVCGIARSPSVALGGILLANRHRLAPYHSPKSSQHDSEPLSTSPSRGFCGGYGFRSCLSSYGKHKALLLGLTGIFCAVVLAAWPLTYQCRRRRQRRRRAREIRENLRLAEGDPPTSESPPPPPPPTQQPPSENDPLLGNRNATSYGGDPLLDNRGATTYGGDSLLGDRDATV